MDERQVDNELNPDFTDQPILDDPTAAPGATGSLDSDRVAEGDEVYVPPTDPVVTTDRHGRAQILGGFTGSSTDEIEVERSSDGQIGDEALADAIRQELREDAATTDLEVEVEVVGGVAYLRGTVRDLDDAGNAEEVAGRVPGVVEVREMLEVPSI